MSAFDAVDGASSAASKCYRGLDDLRGGVEAARHLVRERCQIGEDGNDQFRSKREVLPDRATKSAVA